MNLSFSDCCSIEIEPFTHNPMIHIGYSIKEIIGAHSGDICAPQLILIIHL